MRTAATGFLLAALVLIWQAAQAKPSRIVSLNLCTDQLVLLLAQPERIAALSFLARDPHLSYMAEAAKAYRVVRGSADEVVLLEPDLVFAQTYGARSTVALLRELDIRVLELPLANSLDDVRRQVRTVAEALGEEARGERLIADMEARLARTAPSPRPLSAVVYQANGYAVGPDTLVDDVLGRAGLVNIAPRLGLSRGGYLPLETLLIAEPQVLIVEEQRPGASSLAEQLLDHPALKRAIAGKPLVRMPSRLWICGGPFVVEAVELLAASARKTGGGE